MSEMVKETTVAFFNVEFYEITFLEICFADAQPLKRLLTLSQPIAHGAITNWEDMEKVWHHTFHNVVRMIMRMKARAFSFSPLALCSVIDT